MGSQSQRDGEPKWASLLQPIKDLEKNWDVDIAGELTDYLEDLSGLTFEVDGLVNLNFAEAAMVVYSSSCTYGKKVEYLMKLTMSALEAAKNRHRNGAAAGKRKKGEGSLGGQVLGVLDIVEDIVKAGCKAPNLDLSTLQAVQIPPQVPPLLLDLSDTTLHRTVASSEAGHNDSGMAMSTAAMMSPSDAPSFNMMRCHVHQSGAMLLLASDGAAFDAHLNSAEAMAALAQGSRHAGARVGGPGTPLREVGPGPAAFGSPVAGGGASPGAGGYDGGAEQYDGGWCDGGDDYPDGDGGEPPAGWEEQAGAVAAAHNGSERALVQRGDPAERDDGLGDDELMFDPYRPLNAHDASTTVDKPYKKLVPRIPKFKTEVQLPTYQPFALPSAGAAPEHLQFIYPCAVAAARAKTRRAAPHPSDNFSPLVNAPGPAFQPEPSLAAGGALEEATDAAAEPAWMFAGMQCEDGGHEDAHGFAFGDDCGDDDFGGADFDHAAPDEECAARAHDAENVPASQGTGAAYDDLVAMYSQAVAAAASAADMQSSLSRKVSNWRTSIGSIMVEQDQRPAFDIQETGNKILRHVSELVAQIEPTGAKALPFHAVVQCSSKYEVARSFSAFLQLVNNEKVNVLRGCSTADPFHVELLSVQNKAVAA